MANKMRPQCARSDRRIKSYGRSTEVVSKWSFLANFCEYGSENGLYLRLEWSKIDTTNTVVLEKDCSKIAVLQFLIRNF